MFGRPDLPPRTAEFLRQAQLQYKQCEIAAWLGTPRQHVDREGLEALGPAAPATPGVFAEPDVEAGQRSPAVCAPASPTPQRCSPASAHAGKIRSVGRAGKGAGGGQNGERKVNAIWSPLVSPWK